MGLASFASPRGVIASIVMSGTAGAVCAMSGVSTDREIAVVSIGVHTQELENFRETSARAGTLPHGPLRRR
jgi:hypothetical protein